MTERGSAYRVMDVNLKEVNYLEDPDVDGSITLRYVFGKWDEGVWNGLIWLRIGAGGGLLKTR
jgi:hypothetical protein